MTVTIITIHKRAGLVRVILDVNGDRKTIYVPESVYDNTNKMDLLRYYKGIYMVTWEDIDTQYWGQVVL